MTISFFTNILEVIAWTFFNFTPLLWVFGLAVICACVNIIRSIIGGRGIW